MRAPIEGRNDLQQAVENLANAERAVMLLPPLDGPYVPCPSIVAVSEIRNAVEYIKKFAASVQLPIDATRK